MSESVDEFDFDLAKKAEIPVKYDGKRYVLREASAEASRQWRNTILRITKMGPEGSPRSLEGAADMETLLVSLCLFPVGEDDKVGEKNVHLNVVRSWPNRFIRQLFEKAKEISHLGEFEESDSDNHEVIKQRIAALSAKLNGGQVPPAESGESVDGGDEKLPPSKPRRRTMWG